MIQRNTYTSRKNNPPQKFIPRRDLFPDTELPPPGRTATKTTGGSGSPYREQSGNSFYKISTGREQTAGPYRNNVSGKEQTGSQYNKSQQAQSQARIQPIASGKGQSNKSQPLPLQQPLKPVKQQSLLPANPAVLFFLLAGGFLLWPKLKAFQPGLTAGIESAFRNVLDNPQSIQMLRTLGPYMEVNEQDAVYGAAGFMEAISTFRDVMNHTYQDRHRNTIQHVPSNPAARKIEAIKAVKPYIAQSSHKQLGKFIGAYDTIDQLNRNIEIYRNNRSLAGDRKASAIESIGEILNVVRPVLPREHREKADKAIQVLKMAEVVGTAEKLSRDGKKDKASTQEKTSAAPSEKPAEAAETTDRTDQIQKMMGSFAPMLNDEQKQSMDLIMKMAQMLTQPGSDAQEPNSEGN
jgi:hypothetical protein